MIETNYLERRKREILINIEMWTDYIEKSQALNWTNETGVGRSYQSRRKSRFGAIHQSRVDEKIELVKKLKRELKEVENKLK